MMQCTAIKAIVCLCEMMAHLYQYGQLFKVLIITTATSLQPTAVVCHSFSHPIILAVTSSLVVRTLWLAIVSVQFPAMTLPRYFCDRGPSFLWKIQIKKDKDWIQQTGLSWDVTTTPVNSALHPSEVAKSSTSFGWGKGRKHCCQVVGNTVWSHMTVISRSGVVILISNFHISLILPWKYISWLRLQSGSQSLESYCLSVSQTLSLLQIISTFPFTVIIITYDDNQYLT